MGEVKKGYVRPLDLKQGRVDMGHGAGGRAMAQLIDEVFARAFANEWLGQGNDGAVLPAPAAGERLVMATDAHVVSPLFFPGGDIGCLSVHGTINDVAVMGARPLYLAASFILEEGFALADLVRIVESMAAAAREAGVPVVAYGNFVTILLNFAIMAFIIFQMVRIMNKLKRQEAAAPAAPAAPAEDIVLLREIRDAVRK